MTARRNREPERRKASILLSHGRSIFGMRPGHAGNRGGGSLDLWMARQRGCPETETVEEYEVRDHLARQLDAVTEAQLPLGFADVITAQAVFEVEPRHTWREGARQVLAYAAQCDLPPALALYRAIPAAEMLAIFTKLQAITLHGLRSDRIALWWWTGKTWQQITSPALCANMPLGAVFGSCKYCNERVAWLGDSKICHGYEPTRPIGEMHCCPELCLTTHENQKWCSYWAAQRAFPAR